MRNSLIALAFLFILAPLSSQIVDCSRTAVLSDGAYEMSGTAYLERFDDGSIQIRLGEDFLTESGPDVQIFLSNDSTSTAGGVMLADIGIVDGISHFSGMITFEVPSSVTMATYEFVVFRCVTAQAYWGGGRLNAPTCDDPGSTGGGSDTTMIALCLESTVATTNWASEVTICPNDGLDDIVPLMNTIMTPAGDHYGYVFADASNNIRFIHLGDNYNFEGSSLETDYVFGVSYYGALTYNVGDPITSITADTCAQLSSMTTFLTVNKENCATAFDCLETITATTNWATTASVCPGDGSDDIVPFINNKFQDPGDHYAYLITDTLNRLIEVVLQPNYNFENVTTLPNRVFGVSYSGTLNYDVGASITNITADSCSILSDTSLYLTVLMDECEAPTYSISGKVTNSKSEAIIGVDIINEDNVFLAQTDAKGLYTIEGLTEGETITLKARGVSALANGLSVSDLTRVVNHVLGRQEFISPYQLIASDVNNNGSISAGDLVPMKGAILGRFTEFSNNSNWKFIDASQELDLNLSSFSIRESIELTIGNVNITDIDFIGVKIGDVNNTADLDLSKE